MGSLVKWFNIERKQKRENMPASQPIQEEKEAPVPEWDEEIRKKKEALALARDETLWKKVTHAAMEYVADEMRVKDAGSGKIDIGLELPGTENLGIIAVEPDSEDNELVWMNVKVVRKGVDYCRMYYDRLGTYDESLAYLEDESHADHVSQKLREMSEKIDEDLE